MTDRNTKITTSQIADGTLLPTDLNATNSPVDNYVISYDEATGKFEWVVAGGDHNDLSNIQGGTASEYYHLTSADYTELSQWLDNVTLGSDGKLTLPNGTDINEFSTDDTLGGDSDDAVPTEQAVKAYVDGKTYSLSDLTDIDFDSGTPADNNVLTYDSGSGKWKSEAPTGGASELSDLSDVGVTTPTNKNVLVADGGSWESRALVEADISDLGTYLENLLEDTTPQLGGDLDLNTHNIDFPSVANVSDVKDEDNMASDSATMLATQQSIKKYVDDNTQTLFEIDINGDLQPVTTTQVDASFELDGNDDIQPQLA